MFDPIKAFIEYGSGRDIETVIVDGKIVVERRRVVGVDEADLHSSMQAEGEGIPWLALQVQPQGNEPR